MKHNMGKILKLLAIAGLIATLLCSAFAFAEEEGAPIEAEIEAQAEAVIEAEVVAPVPEEVQIEAKSFEAQLQVSQDPTEFQQETEALAPTDTPADDSPTEAPKPTISESKAKSAALKKAKVKSGSVKEWVEVRLDGDEWEIEFKTSKYKYDVEVNAYSGKIDSYEKEALPKEPISESKAKSAALKKAGVKSGSVKEWIEVRLDGDEWDIEFKTATYKFGVDVNAYSGKVVEFKKEALPKEPITEAQAKSAALKKAKLKSSAVKEWIKVQRDGDEWEVDFKTSTYKYEVEVNAYSGKITEYKREALPKEPLTEAQAKSAALKKAGVKSGSVKEWIKVQLDGGEWEVEFKTSTYKYEVEINASSGKVVEYKREALPKEPLTEAQAKSAALKKAGVKSSSVKEWTKVQRDGDEWDVEFKTATYKYDMDVDAYSGKVSDFHKEALPKDPITATQAKTAALKRAGVSSAAVTEWIRVWLDGNDWEIVFRTAAYKYEVEIDALSGRVTDYDREILSGERISEEEAKAAALERADVLEDDVKLWLKVLLDGDEWEIEFLTASYKYEVEISAYTGLVKSFEQKGIPTNAVASITLADAKAIALEHAREQFHVTGKVKYTKAKLDRDDGWLLYDIEFRCDRREFEYEIDANNGDILDWDMEWDD